MLKRNQLIECRDHGDKREKLLQKGYCKGEIKNAVFKG